MRLLTFIFLTTFVCVADKTMTVRINTPLGNRVGPVVHVSAFVTSSIQIKKVVAKVETREIDLKFQGDYQGTLSLDGLTTGKKLLEVRAVDIYGTEGVASKEVIYNTAPQLKVSAPLAESVARPTLPIEASCNDEDPCEISMIVSPDISGKELPYCPQWASQKFGLGKNRINQIIDFSKYEGQTVNLCITAKNSAGLISYVNRIIYVDSSKTLKSQLELTGRLIQVLGERILFVEDGLSSNQFWNKLKILNQVAGTIQEIPLPKDKAAYSPYTQLTSQGVIFGTGNPDEPTIDIHLWNGTNLKKLGTTAIHDSFKANEHFAIWNSWPYSNTIYRYSVSNDEITKVTEKAGEIKNEVNESGQVAFWKKEIFTGDCSRIYDFNVYLYDLGNLLALSKDTDAVNSYPLIGENGTMYRKTKICGDKNYDLVFNDGNKENILTTYFSHEPLPGMDYQINGNWLTYTRWDGTGPGQVWLRELNGKDHQMSFFGTESYVDALSDSGHLSFKHEGRRFLGRFDKPSVDISSRLGKLIYVGGRPYLMLGRQLFAVS